MICTINTIYTMRTTCTARSRITFRTDQTLGCWSSGGGYAGGQLGTYYYAAWGRGDRWDSLSTTNLWVKVYQAWPRHLTVYDPRYFAVHHFNPGLTDERNNPSNYAAAFDFKVETKHEWITQTDPADDQRKRALYEIDVPKHTIDIRQPSACTSAPKFEDWDINKPVKLSFGSFMYKNINIDKPALGPNVNLEVIGREHWIIDTRRRAKQLLL